MAQSFNKNNGFNQIIFMEKEESDNECEEKESRRKSI